MVLRRALKQAVLWRILSSNPSDAVRPPRAERKEIRALSEAEVRLLLTTASDTRQYVIWVFLVTTGVRLGEALGLKWSDIEIAESRAHIRRALQRQRGVGSVFVEPKTAKSRRTVPMPEGTVDALLNHRCTQEADRKEAGKTWVGHDLVFSSPVGRPLDMSSLSLVFHRTLKRAGLPPYRIHDLRHTTATHLLTKHVHPKIVQDLLGHSTIAITLDTYSHVMPALSKESSIHMSSLLPPVG
ncbi:MAG: tyrosine-type recombinase/integrase [Candidatus Dormibacteraceae bacterium]